MVSFVDLDELGLDFSDVHDYAAVLGLVLYCLRSFEYAYLHRFLTSFFFWQAGIIFVQKNRAGEPAPNLL